MRNESERKYIGHEDNMSRVWSFIEYSVCLKNAHSLNTIACKISSYRFKITSLQPLVFIYPFKQLCVVI